MDALVRFSRGRPLIFALAEGHLRILSGARIVLCTRWGPLTPHALRMVLNLTRIVRMHSWHISVCVFVGNQACGECQQLSHLSMLQGT